MEKTCFGKPADYLFSVIAKRLKDRKKALKLKNRQIIPNNEPLVSWILNNRRTCNNNYLIPDTHLEPLCDVFKFESVDEMLWGSPEEMAQIGGVLFELTIGEMLRFDTELLAAAKQALLADATFAKACAFQNFLKERNCSDNCFETHFFADWICDEDELDRIRRNAIGRLYSKINNVFLNVFGDYFNGRTLFKLDKTIQTFATEALVPLLYEVAKSNRTDIGYTTYNLLSAYFDSAPTEVDFNLYEPGNYHNYCTPETEEDVSEIKQELNDHYLLFVNNLIGIQTRLGYSDYTKYLEDKRDAPDSL